jgi:peptide/nickel transport system substrate-binding protein
VVFVISHDPNTAIARVLAGEANFIEQLRPVDMARVERRPELRTILWSDLTNGLLMFNLHDPATSARAHPLFGDRAVRRAITMALDRSALVASMFGSTASVADGPVPASLLHGMVLPRLPYDTAAALRVLQKRGWRLDAERGTAGMGGDRVLERDGRPFAFTLLVPTSNSSGLALAVMVQDQLRRIGVRVTVEPLEFTSYVERLREHRFDVALLTLDWDPSPATIRQIWSTAAAAPGGSDFGGYMNPALDALLDTANTISDPERALAAYRRAWTMLFADAPAVWLYNGRRIAALGRNVHPTGLRPDSWWANLDHWTIDPPVPASTPSPAPTVSHAPTIPTTRRSSAASGPPHTGGPFRGCCARTRQRAL